MRVIEEHLHRHFANLGASQDDVSFSLPDTAPTAPPTLDQPFAKINSVVPGSPAERAGLKPGDQVRNFGYVNHANHDNLKKVAECVQANEGVRCAPYPDHTSCRTLLMSHIAKRTGQSISSGRSGISTRTAADFDAGARLGRSGTTGLPYLAPVREGNKRTRWDRSIAGEQIMTWTTPKRRCTALTL